MKCEACLSLLDDYLDGELEQSLSLQVGGHLTACIPCAARYEELEREQKIFSGYLVEIEPTQQLWRTLEATIEQRRSERRTSSRSRLYGSLGILGLALTRQRWHSTGLAKSIITAIVVAVLSAAVTGPLPGAKVSDGSKGVGAPVVEQSGERAGDQSLIGTEPASGTSSSEALDGVGHAMSIPRSTQSGGKNLGRNRSRSDREIASKESLLPGEGSYLQAIARLTVLIEKGTDVRLKSDLRAEYRRNLAAVDKAIAATRRAARNHPDDPDMRQFVLAAYRGKLGLLSTIVDQSRAVTSPY